MFAYKVLISRLPLKQLRKMPFFISDKLQHWGERVELVGLDEVRKIKGFHDEPLYGERNKSYRAIYVQNNNGDLILIEVIEVSNHEY